jgi:hypothetical protein
MKQDHITDILDNAPVASLSESEMQTIRAHVSTCAECERAFAAAQLSALLMKERTSEAAQNALNANPFFQTRVIAAWREQQASVGAWSLRRLWNATGALVASMAATTAVLAVLAFAAPSADTTSQVQAAVVPYSAETVVLDQDQDNQLTNDQVISAIYADDDEGK